jgi:hypothetical protein
LTLSIESEVIFVKDMLYAGAGLLSAIIAVFSMWRYLGQPRADASNLMLFVAIIFAILAIACGALFLSSRVNKTEDIHVTE